jgi:phage baseplate assembly protein W|tara:strand:+ start:1689 stop:2120 length:432 start_codon:yes stop_codon:yes gene_type:complete
MSGFTDAQGQNDISRNVRQYRDLDLFFGRKPVSGDVNILTDITNIKRAVRNLVLTNIYEKPFHPEIGSGVRDMLFENMTPLTSIILSKKVEEVIENFEPRVRLMSVSARPDLDRNIYEMTIEFFIKNAPTELVTVDVFLERLR